MSVSIATDRWSVEPAADVAGILRRMRERFEIEARPTAKGPGEVLAEVCDLAGCVALAELVSAGSDLPEPAVQVDDGRWLAAFVERQLDSLGRWLEKRLRDPHRGPNKLPNRSKTQEALADPEQFEQSLGRFARIWEQRTLAILRTIRRDARRIRADSGSELRALAPRAALLERLDGALRNGTLQSTTEHDEQAAALVAECFVAAARRAAHPEAEPVSWQWLGALRHDADCLVRAVLAEERALLTHLVDGCIAAARVTQPDEWEMPEDEDEAGLVRSEPPPLEEPCPKST